MREKSNDLMAADWDVLIILDACRHDYFAEAYGDFFRGKLEQRISLGSSTPEWRIKTFKKTYNDIVYISANPYINSRTKIKGFRASDHFFKIIDVWQSHWDESAGTVQPKDLNEVSEKTILQFRDKRFIIHYLQPHAPYLSKRYPSTGFLRPDLNENVILDGVKGIKNNKLLELILMNFGYLLKKIGLLNNVWDIRAAMKLPPLTPMDALRREYGLSGLRNAYRDNLKIVLDYCSKLCYYILEMDDSKKIVISSDHGELLGEKGAFSHHKKSKNPILLKVPFFRVNGKSTISITSKSSSISLEQLEKEKLRSTVRRLKTSGRL